MAVRKQGPFESPYGNSPRSRPSFLTAVVDGIDPDKRSLRVSYLGQESGPAEVAMWGDFGGCALPVPNTLVFIAIDDAGRGHAIGCRENGWPQRLENNQVPPIKSGEQVWQSKEFGQRMFFRQDGGLELMTNGEEGIEIKPTRRFRIQRSPLFEVLSGAVRMSLGVVRRATGISLTLDEDNVIPTVPGGPPHREFCVDIGYLPQPPPASPLQRAFRFIGGTGVIDDNGAPELGSFAKLPLRFVLEVLAPGVSSVLPLSAIQVDAVGNFSLSSAAVTQFESAIMTRIMAPVVQIKAGAILLGSYPLDVAMMAYRFLLFFSQHIHLAAQAPAGILPTTPPVVPIPGPFVAAERVFIQ